MRLEFIVPGPPVPLQRARRDPRRIWLSKSGKVVQGKWITPIKSVQYKIHVASCAAAALRKLGLQWPLDAHYGLSIRAYRQRDAGDLSNITKSVEDALERILWRNDKLIVEHGHSAIGVDREKPRLEVEAWVVT